MDSQRAARRATFSVGIAVASYAAYQLGKLVQRKRHDAKNNTSCVELRPPVPDEVVQLLRSSVLCYLSTLADGAPHLSLMNFTYCPADEKIIMSTRRDTTKYRALLKNKRVAVLIHDFPAEERQRAAAASARAAGHSGDYAQTLRDVVWKRPGRDGRRGRAVPRDTGTQRRGPAAIHRRRQHRHPHRARGQGAHLQPGRQGPHLGRVGTRRAVAERVRRGLAEERVV